MENAGLVGCLKCGVDACFLIPRLASDLVTGLRPLSLSIATFTVLVVVQFRETIHSHFERSGVAMNTADAVFIVLALVRSAANNRHAVGASSTRTSLVSLRLPHDLLRAPY